MSNAHKLEIEAFLSEAGWPAGNRHNYDELTKIYRDHGLTYFRQAWQLANEFDGIELNLNGREVVFDTLYYVGGIEVWNENKIESIVGEKVIVIADEGTSSWLVGESGKIYSDWSGVIVFDGEDIYEGIFNALKGKWGKKIGVYEC